MINDLINEMVDAGVHYGHQTKKWNPRMKPFLMKDKGGIYIINLEKTVQQLDKAADFLGVFGERFLFPAIGGGLEEGDERGGGGEDDADAGA